jgi:phospholipid-translocating ATPase
MIMSLILFENEFLNIVSISFTALVLNELIMVALEITIWYDASSRFGWGGWLTYVDLRHVYMVIAEIVTLLLYAVSIIFLPEYFGMCFYSLS